MCEPTECTNIPEVGESAASDPLEMLVNSAVEQANSMQPTTNIHLDDYATSSGTAHNDSEQQPRIVKVEVWYIILLSITYVNPHNYTLNC